MKRTLLILFTISLVVLSACTVSSDKDCSTLSGDDLQECCQLVHSDEPLIKCVGYWTFENNTCSFVCGSELAECYSDFDCATGGCSGEICGKKGEVEDIISICDFKEEYNCLKTGGCLCIDGKCQWNKNSDYDSCIADLE